MKSLTSPSSRRQRVHSDQLLQQTISLPSLREQQRIARRIEELVAPIRKASELRASAAEQADALYPVARDKIFHDLKCERQPIGSLFELVDGRAFKPGDWQDTGRKIIRIQNLKYSDAAYNRYPFDVDKKFLVHSGDVLFAWSGQIVSLGAHIWQGEEAILNQHIFNVRARQPLLAQFVKEGLKCAR
jgi:type I restriction enzyme S subunit